MLHHSLGILKTQQFKDFEIVVSDHSVDDHLYAVCKKESKWLNIKYLRNEHKRGSSSANVNHAIKNCSGELIKILCQDDYLFAHNSLKTTVDQFDYDKKWLVSSYLHTKDRVELENYHAPEISRRMYLENLIGTHSCLTILNEKPLFFDEDLIWFMDCEYYFRLYQQHGLPEIVYKPTVVQYLWTGQVTNSVITDRLIQMEKKHVINKHERPLRSWAVNVVLRNPRSTYKQQVSPNTFVGAKKVAEKYYFAAENSIKNGEYLETLKSFASTVGHATEIYNGSGISTWAMIAGNLKRLVSIDTAPTHQSLLGMPHQQSLVKRICKSTGIDFSYFQADSSEFTLEKTDLLYIDVSPTYSDKVQVLHRYGNYSNKWIILHYPMTHSKYYLNTQGILEGGIQDAIDEFLFNNQQWLIKEIDQSGLTILERK